MSDHHDPIGDILKTLDSLPDYSEEQAHTLLSAMAARGVDPSGALAQLYAWLGAAQKADAPNISDTHIVIFLAAYADISPLSAIANFQEALRKGATATNLLCVDGGLGLRVLDLASQHPYTLGDFDAARFAATIAFGTEAAAAGGSVLCISDGAFGNEAFALSVVAALHPKAYSAAEAKVPEPLQNAVAQLRDTVEDDAAPLDYASALAGPDVAGAIGAVMGARATGQALVFDGMAALAAYAVLRAISPSHVQHCRFAGANTDLEQVVAEILDLMPILSGASGTGPGSSSALAWRQMKAACDLAGLRAPKPSVA